MYFLAVHSWYKSCLDFCLFFGMCLCMWCWRMYIYIYMCVVACVHVYTCACACEGNRRISFSCFPHYSVMQVSLLNPEFTDTASETASLLWWLWNERWATTLTHLGTGVINSLSHLPRCFHQNFEVRFLGLLCCKQAPIFTYSFSTGCFSNTGNQLQGSTRVRQALGHWHAPLALLSI